MKKATCCSSSTRVRIAPSCRRRKPSWRGRSRVRACCFRCSAQREARRYQGRLARRVRLTYQRLARSEGYVAAARAALDSAKLNLEFTRITAPISGRVSQAAVTAGNLVTGGRHTTLLTTVVSVDPIYVKFEGDEQVYLKYAELARRGERSSSRDAAIRCGSASPTRTAIRTKASWCSSTTSSIRTPARSARALVRQQGPLLHAGPVRAREAARPQLVSRRADQRQRDRHGSEREVRVRHRRGQQGRVSAREARPPRSTACASCGRA